MKLSIIIPCFNSSNNILQLLKLLHFQQKQNVEVLIINDGSTDNTFDIVADFIGANRLANFRLFDKINEGAAKTREFGLSLALGEYVFFCDSDDYIAPNFTNEILSVIYSESPDLIYFNSLITKQEYNYCNYMFKVRFSENKEFTSSSLFLKKQIQQGFWTAAVWTFVFKRSCAISSKAYFTPRKAHEDHMFIMMLLFNAKRIRCLNKVLYIQKITFGSLTNSTKDWDYILQRYLAYLEVKETFKGKMGNQTFNLYREWSVTSFIDIILSSKNNLKTVFLKFKFYYILLCNFDIFIKFLLKKIIKKFNF